MTAFVTALRSSPGLWLMLTALVLLFGVGLAVAWLEGWIGAPPFREGCAVVTRTGACT